MRKQTPVPDRYEARTDASYDFPPYERSLGTLAKEVATSITDTVDLCFKGSVKKKKSG